MSGMRFFRVMFTSSLRNFSYCSLMYLEMGSQLRRVITSQGHKVTRL